VLPLREPGMASLVSRTTTTNEEMIMKLVNHRNKSIDSGRKISFTGSKSGSK